MIKKKFVVYDHETDSLKGLLDSEHSMIRELSNSPDFKIKKIINRFYDSSTNKASFIERNEEIYSCYYEWSSGSNIHPFSLNRRGLVKILKHIDSLRELESKQGVNGTDTIIHKQLLLAVQGFQIDYFNTVASLPTGDITTFTKLLYKLIVLFENANKNLHEIKRTFLEIEFNFPYNKYFGFSTSHGFGLNSKTKVIPNLINDEKTFNEFITNAESYIRMELGRIQRHSVHHAAADNTLPYQKIDTDSIDQELTLERLIKPFSKWNELRQLLLKEEILTSNFKLNLKGNGRKKKIVFLFNALEDKGYFDRLSSYKMSNLIKNTFGVEISREYIDKVNKESPPEDFNFIPHSSQSS